MNEPFSEKQLMGGFATEKDLRCGSIVLVKAIKKVIATWHYRATHV